MRYLWMESPYSRGTFPRVPGAVIHGSRSGITTRTIAQEFIRTAEYCQNNPGGLAWQFTIGNDEYAQHLRADQIGFRAGWHAGEANFTHIGFEFAQRTSRDTITDDQIEAFGHAVQTRILPIYPKWLDGLDRGMVMHSELPGGIDQGKSDVYPRFDSRWPALKTRLLEAARGMTVYAEPDPANRVWDRFYNDLSQDAKNLIGHLIYRGNIVALDHYPGGAGVRPFYRTSHGGAFLILGDEVAPLMGFAVDDWEQNQNIQRL